MPDASGSEDAGSAAVRGGGTAKPKTKARRPKFRRRAEARRDEVLDAALDLFTEKGFAATRVDDIAARAGISKGTIYLYFDSKEALMEGLIDRALSPIALNVVSTIDTLGVDPRMAFKAIGALIAKHMGDPKVFAVPKLILRESAQFPELAAIYRRDVLDKVLPVVTRMIEHQIKLGRFRPVDPELALRNIIGPIIGHVVMAEVFGLVPEGGMRMDTFIPHHIDILLNGLYVHPEHKNG